MNVCSIWPFAQISDDFYYLDIWQCARYFVAALFKKLALITIREMWGLESRSRTSRSRLLWQSLGLVSKFEPGLGFGGYGLDYITAMWLVKYFNVTFPVIRLWRLNIQFPSAKHDFDNSVSLKAFTPKVWRQQQTQWSRGTLFRNYKLFIESIGDLPYCHIRLSSCPFILRNSARRESHTSGSA